MDIAPDSRLRDRLKGIVKRVFFGQPVDCTPVFCASCAKHGGYVPTENTTFAFWLCDDCAPKYAPQAGLLTIPDKVFWARVQEEQLERHGRLLTDQELRVAADSPCTALGKLLREGI